MAEYPEHPILEDVRQFRGHDENVSSDEVMRLEALRLSLLGPEQRSMALRDFNNKMVMYDESGTNLRQKALAHGFSSYLINASDRFLLSGSHRCGVFGPTSMIIGKSLVLQFRPS